MTDQVKVTESDRRAYISLNNLPPKYFNAIMDGEWDGTHGMQAFARHRLTALEQGRIEGARVGLEAAAKMMMRAIADGYPDPEKKTDQCEHGKFGWEDCIPCYDDKLCDAADTIRNLDPQAIIAEHMKETVK